MRVERGQRLRAMGWMVALLAGALMAAPAAAQTLLRFATYVNENDPRVQGFKYFGELVEQGTQGRVKVQVFPGGTLHPFAKAIDAILGGVTDIGALGGAAIDRRMPCANATNWLPVSIDMERAVELDLEYNALLADEFANVGLIAVMPQNSSYDQHWFFRTPIQKLDDMKGLLVRSFGPLTTHLIESWGGKAVYMSPTEVFQGAERGVVNGVTMGVGTFNAFKMWTIVPHFVNIKMFYGQNIYAMNKKKFDALSAADQAVVLDAGVKAARWLEPRNNTLIDQQVGHAVMNLGVQVMNIPDADRKRIIDAAAKGWEPKVLEGCGPERTAKLKALFKKYER